MATDCVWTNTWGKWVQNPVALRRLRKDKVNDKSRVSSDDKVSSNNLFYFPERVKERGGGLGTRFVMDGRMMDGWMMSEG